MGGGKFAPHSQPMYFYSGGIDVGGGKFGPSVEESRPAPSMTLVDSRNEVNNEISKLHIYKDAIEQKEKGHKFNFDDYQDYWRHHGISKEELELILNDDPELDFAEKIKQLEIQRRDMEKQLSSATLTGSSYFNNYDKDKTSKEFIFLLGKKLLE